jgi:SNF2 family DNA or RNA helicase
MGLADAVWLLSGTPMMGSADELWPWMRAFGVWDRGYWDFAERFTKYVETPWGRKIVGNRNAVDLRKLMAPVLLRRKEEDVELELPPLVVTTRVVDPIEIDPTNKHLKDIHNINEILRANVGTVADLYAVGFPPDFGKKYVGTDNMILSARRTCGLLKVRGYASLARHELANYREHHDGQRLDKLVVFCIHKVVVDYLRVFLPEFEPRIIYGGTPMAQRDKILAHFNDPLSKCRLLICNINAAGVGLNITGARHVDILEPSWVPAENEQAIKRLHRIGQVGTVRARYIGLAGTMDEHISNVLAEKTRRISEILD